MIPADICCGIVKLLLQRFAPVLPHLSVFVTHFLMSTTPMIWTHLQKFTQVAMKYVPSIAWTRSNEI